MGHDHLVFGALISSDYEATSSRIQLEFWGSCHIVQPRGHVGLGPLQGM